MKITAIETTTMNDDQTCDLLVHNAYVISVDAERRVFSPGAVAVRGRRVAAVGPEREVMHRLRAARTIDARGAAVHPGFIDAHNHVVGAGCRGVFANEAFDPASGINYAAWKADVERHEALLNLAVVRDHRHRLVAASRLKLRAA